ncbi:MAG: hypothetical protein A2888_02085 [Chlamydiae bacterium RIFCSPLOWO2_01_FULL_28_7]|nr:MAG: hypothetical protein A2888_02085 [Chlamydiae bacterium RIFCSPLOWO2_01_FULL_28_7]
MNIIFIGFKAVGKSFIGNEIAKLLKKDFFDVDKIMLDLSKKKNITELFKENEAFSFYENETLKILEYKKNSVISFGGRTLLNPNVLKFKKFSFFILLEEEKEILRKRITKDSIFQDQKYFDEEYENRKLIYEEFKNIKILTRNRNFKEILNEIIENEQFRRYF